MSKWLTDAGELDRLNAFCAGKTIAGIEFDADDFTLRFTDGSRVRLSTLGGLEIAELAVGKSIQFTTWDTIPRELRPRYAATGNPGAVSDSYGMPVDWPVDGTE